MKIFALGNTEADTPPGGRWLARLYVPMVGRGGGTVMDWHPVIFQAATEETVREKAATWWAAEVEKTRLAAAKSEEKAVKRAAKRERSGVPDDAEEVEEAF